MKVTDRFKLRRKRMQGASLMPTNRVNKFLAQAIDARSIDQEKANHVNLLSLCFRDSEKERLVSARLRKSQAGRRGPQIYEMRMGIGKTFLLPAEGRLSLFTPNLAQTKSLSGARSVGRWAGVVADANFIHPCTK